MSQAGNSGGRWPDELTRKQVESQLGLNLYIEAGAGTGKTNALVLRLTELLATRTAEPEQIAAITFTRAAAFEMRSRLRAHLEKRENESDEADTRKHITSVLDNLDALAIQTIHSFALSMLREHPLDAGLPPVIEPLDDIQAAIEFENRWQEWFTDRIESDPGLAPALGVAQRLGINGPVDHLRKLANDFGETLESLQTGMFKYDGPSPPSIPVTLLAETLAKANAIVETAPDPADAMCVQVKDVLKPSVRAMLALAGDAEELPASDFVDWVALKPRVGAKKNWGSTVGDLEKLRELLQELQSSIDRAVDVLKDQTLGILLTAASDFAIEFAGVRRSQGRLTFHDQLTLACALLQTSEAARKQLRNRFKFILVDEFQDTDPVQISLLEQLASDGDGGLRPGSLFIVGDPKQSIYRFRGADPSSSRAFTVRVDTSGGTLPLSENHRSLPGILEWVNLVFAGWMKEGSGQATHKPLHWDDAVGSDTEVGTPVRWFGGPRESTTADVRRLEFEEVSAIAEAAGRGEFRVRGDDKRWRDSTFADVAILVKRRSGLNMLEDALVQKRVPYVLDGQAPLFTSQDIRDLHACLAAIDDPSNEVAILSALRSPAFSCSDADLLRWKHYGGSFNYLVTRDPEPESPVSEAFQLLQNFHDLSREIDTASLLEHFIRHRRLREKAMLTRLGPERTRRLDLCVELANALSDPSTGTGVTLRDFTRWLARQSEENAQMPERVSQGDPGNAVRIMTIHGSKGLEFPIVIMNSAQGGASNSDTVKVRRLREQSGEQRLEVKFGKMQTPGTELAVEQDKEEGALEDVRLMYVAATRARDHLLVSRYCSSLPRSRGNPLIASIEHHLKGNTRLWERWEFHGRNLPHAPTQAIPLETAADHDRWKTDRGTVISNASRTRYTTPTALKPDADTEAPLPKEAAPGLDDERIRSGRAATDRGRAVHAVLQHIDLLNWDESSVKDMAARMAHEHGIPEITSQIANLASAALTSEVMQHATESARRGKAWREVSIAAPLPGGAGELEGQIDLLFIDQEGKITIVDHKTDTYSGTSLEEAARPYFLQMGAYAWCAERVSADIHVDRAVLLFADRALNRVKAEYELTDLRSIMEEAVNKATERVSTSPIDR